MNASTVATRKQIAGFLLRFLIVLAVLAGGIAILSGRYNEVPRRLCFSTAEAVGAVASAVSTQVTSYANRVSYRDFTIEVVSECTGLTEIIIFIAAVVAFPAGFGRKVLGALTGAAVILAANLLRMVTLLWIGATSHYWFTICHYYTYQASMLLLVIGTWILWLRYVVHRQKKGTAVIPA